MSAPPPDPTTGSPPVVDRATPTGNGWAVMWRVELVKLAAQLKVRVALGLCVLGPVLFGVALSVQDQVPADTIFGRWVHESGFAVSFVALEFSGQWVLPILASVVAGDICADEDRHHTWSLLLTRSCSRWDVLAGKLLASATYIVVTTCLLGAVTTATGVVTVGDQPVVGLSGAVMGSGAALCAVVLSWLSVLAPTLAVGAIAVLVSVVSRNGWVGVVTPVVVVLLCNLVSLLSAIDPIRALLPTTGFEAWHGLARVGTYTDQLVISLVVSAAWVAVCSGAAAAVMVRRDVVGA